jgi:hypothetical protein
MAATALLKLAGSTNDLCYVDIAHQALAQMQGMMTQYPHIRLPGAARQSGCAARRNQRNK